MPRYVGVKLVDAVEERHHDFLKGRNQGRIPETAGADSPGYRITYSDGYVSWSPKATFEEANIEASEDADVAGIRRLVAATLSGEAFGPVGPMLDRIEDLERQLSDAMTTEDPEPEDEPKPPKKGKTKKEKD